MSGIMREVVERHHSTSSSSQSKAAVYPNVSSSSGFPIVQHRSKPTSAFKRARQDGRVQETLNASRDKISGQAHYSNSKELLGSEQKVHTSEGLMAEISRSNAEILDNMSEDQRTQERQEIFDHFGTDIGDLVQKVRKARDKRAINQPTPETSEAGVTKSTSESSRTVRRIRFADPTDADVHVYESQPPSPKRVLALLPPPDDSISREDVMSLGNLKSVSSLSGLPLPSSSQDNTRQESTLLEEGTPEDIRRNFFPFEPAAENNPSLTWMLSSPPSSSASHVDDNDVTLATCEIPNEAVRYSLSGIRLSSSQIRHLPTHLGLHHHASTSSDSPAGYTLQDLLLLARSSVPAQRSSALGVLAKILKISYEEYFSSENSFKSTIKAVKLDAMRRDVLDAAIDALDEKGGVGRRAADALWEAVVGYTQAALGIDILDNLPLVDLTPPSQANSGSAKTASVSKGFPQSMVILVSLPLDKMLPAVKRHLLMYTSPVSSTYMQILEIIFVLSHFGKHARMIVDLEVGNDAINAILTSHLQSSTGSDDLRALIASIRILQILAQNGKDIALTLLGPADVLLRYVITPIPSKDTPEWLNGVTLLQETLIFYTVLGRYGLYAHVATTAQSHFAQIASWISSNLFEIAMPSVFSLAKTYIRLLEVWIVCSTDPHRTTPPHDILWSQVRGWAWAQWIFDISERLAMPASTCLHDKIRLTTDLWVAICHAIAAWAESASVNGIRGGEEEKALILSKFGPAFKSEHGPGARITLTIEALEQWRTSTSDSIPTILETFTDLSANAEFMVGVTRLSLACFSCPGECPLGVPSKEIRNLCRYLISDDGPPGLFEIITGNGNVEGMPQQLHTCIRSVSNMLGLELLLWHQFMSLEEKNGNGQPIAWKEDWTAQTLQVLPIFLPGDELLVKRLLECLCNIADRVFIRNILPSVGTPDGWECNMETLLPFFVDTLLPNPSDDNNLHQQQKSCISSFWPIPESLSLTTTIMLPSLSYLRDSWKSYDKKFFLPIRNSWPTWPLNHLLRSGSSSAFKNLPAGWDATESDVVRLALLLAGLCQELNSRQNSRRASLSQMSRTEAIFACMEVFMLEHGQQQLDSGEEVFRDDFINRRMDDLLSPFTYGHCQSQLQLHDILEAPLDYHSKGLLGSTTPFFQFYTDFVALYDAISFSHPIFARLLLPPIDMTYAMDYRKLLFGDYSHVLRTIKPSPDEIFSDDLRRYLWPIETSPHMLSWYLKALMTPSVEGFIRWLALHHVAGNIWKDIDHDHPANASLATTLLSALAIQGDDDTIKDVVMYMQSKTAICLPPKCFERRNTVVSRLDQVQQIEDHRARERLRVLFIQ